MVSENPCQLSGKNIYEAWCNLIIFSRNGWVTYMGIYYVSGVPFGDELYHHGIKGQKWGVRRYQNPDGSLTNEGRAKYSVGEAERDLGLGNKKRLNSVEKRFRNYYRANKNAEDRMYKKAAKASFNGKDPTKFINRAKNFANGAAIQKKMNMNFQKLDERERKRVNRSIVAGQYAVQFLFGAIGQGVYQLNVDKQLQKRFG